MQAEGFSRAAARDQELAGSIPVLGDIFDFFFHANKRNRQILKNFVDSQVGCESAGTLASL